MASRKSTGRCRLTWLGALTVIGGLCGRYGMTYYLGPTLNGPMSPELRPPMARDAIAWRQRFHGYAMQTSAADWPPQRVLANGQQQTLLQRPAQWQPRSRAALLSLGAEMLDEAGHLLLGGMVLHDAYPTPFNRSLELMDRVARHVDGLGPTATSLTLAELGDNGRLHLALQLGHLDLRGRNLTLHVIDMALPAASCGRYLVDALNIDFTELTGDRGCDDRHWPVLENFVPQALSPASMLHDFLRYLQKHRQRNMVEAVTVEVFQSGQIYLRSVQAGHLGEADVLTRLGLPPAYPHFFEGATGILAHDAEGIFHLDVPLEGQPQLERDLTRIELAEAMRLHDNLWRNSRWLVGYRPPHLADLLAQLDNISDRHAMLEALRSKLRVYDYSASPLETYDNLAKHCLKASGSAYLMMGDEVRSGRPTAAFLNHAKVRELETFLELVGDVYG